MNESGDFLDAQFLCFGLAHKMLAVINRQHFVQMILILSKWCELKWCLVQLYLSLLYNGTRPLEILAHSLPDASLTQEDVLKSMRFFLEFSD